MKINPKIGQMITDGYCLGDSDRRGFDREWYEFSPEELDTLVELIAKECMLLCTCENPDPRDSIELQCSNRIKEHFGVE